MSQTVTTKRIGVKDIESTLNEINYYRSDGFFRLTAQYWFYRNMDWSDDLAYIHPLTLMAMVEVEAHRELMNLFCTRKSCMGFVISTLEKNGFSRNYIDGFNAAFRTEESEWWWYETQDQETGYNDGREAYHYFFPE